MKHEVTLSAHINQKTLRPLRALCETYYLLAQMRRNFGDFDGFGLKFIAPNAL
jgi:hypothetical protein